MRTLIYKFIIVLLLSLVNSKDIKENNIKDQLSETIDDKNYTLDGEFELNITLNKDNNITYKFNINSEIFIYILESDTDGYIHYDNDISCTKFCVVQKQNQVVYINYFKNATDKEVNIKIYSFMGFTGEILSLKSNNYILNKIFTPGPIPTLLIFESYTEYIFYLKSIDESILAKCTEYQKDIKISDIISANDNYFRNCNNRINELKPNTIYIFLLTSESYSEQREMLLQPKILDNYIKINSDNEFLYLSNQVNNYILNLTEATDDIEGIDAIALSRYTFDSELRVEESETNITILNKTNLYYIFNKETILDKNVTIKVAKGEGCLIQFLSKFEKNKVTILTEKEYINYKIQNETVLIKFDNNHKNKFINIKVFSENNKEFQFFMASGYAKGNYFQNSLSNKLEHINNNPSSFEIKIYKEDYDLEEDEFFYLILSFDIEEILDESYNITLNKIDKFTTDDLNVDISEEKCKLVIESFKTLYNDGYTYTEIKKNPPNPDYFKAADLISDLNNIKTKDRKYYDFYRDIKEIIGKMRDLHLRMNGAVSPNGYDLGLFTFCLPFTFRIEGNNPSDAKIYIDKSKCFSFYNEEERAFIEKHIGKYVKKINKTDPFEYIQNFGNKFRACYNKHSTFTMNINLKDFPIQKYPLTSQELSNIEFIFEGEEEDAQDSIILDYYLYYTEKAKENAELMELYNEEKSKQYKILETKSILELQNELNKRNNLKNDIIAEEDESEIKWNFSTNDKYKSIQCRFDEKNNLNVFKQTSFYFLGEEYKNAMEVVENCTELFYSNSYPIVGIESYNGGGTCKLSFYFQELLQAKILPVHHDSVKLSQLMKEYVEADIPVINTDPDMYQRIDLETCKPFSKFEDMKEIVDDYGNGITHRRSQYFGIFNSTDLKKHKERRQKYFDMNNLKKPTEILIFTDAYSYSATSFFIKGLQETGAAITVGYFGNPKSDEIFDASQAPSFVGDFNNSEAAKNLLDCGFQLTGVTIYETYNYTYQIKNPTPRDYLIHPVDERINIYKPYNDSLYNNFMEEAKRIFEKYNDNQECNPNNLNLFYDPNNKKDCYIFENDPHAHGGYECDPETKKWSKICKPYYCDIGYFFDKYQNKCIKDICTEDDGDDGDNGSDKKEDNGGLKTWHIILIAVGGLLILLIIIFIILKCRKPKEMETSAETGPLIDQVELKES